jgi:hypothetical protein
MVSLAVSGRAAVPSRNGSVEALEFCWTSGSFISLVFSFVFFLFGFLVEREDTALVPRVGVSNYVASPL